MTERPLWVAAERLPMLAAVLPGAACEPAVVPPERERAKRWTREDGMRELVRGRLEAVGPTTARAIATALGVPAPDVDFALGALEHEGFVLRGRFTPGTTELEWCERRLLARIHRYTLDRLRREIEPVSAADFMRFLLRWQRVAEDARAEGPEGLAAVLELLDRFGLPGGAGGAPRPARPDAGVRPAVARRALPLGGGRVGETQLGSERGRRNAEPKDRSHSHDARRAVSTGAGGDLAVFVPTA